MKHLGQCQEHNICDIKHKHTHVHIHTHTPLLPCMLAPLDVCPARAHGLEPTCRVESDKMANNVQPALWAAVEGISHPLHRRPARVSPPSTSRVKVIQDPASAPRASSLSAVTVPADSPIRRSRGRQGSIVGTALSWDPPGAPRGLKMLSPARLGPLSGSFRVCLGSGGWVKLHLLSVLPVTLLSFLQLIWPLGPLPVTPFPPSCWLERPMIPEEGPDLFHCWPST